MNPPFPYSLVITNNLFLKGSKQIIINICFAFKISDKLWIDTLCNHEKFAGFGQKNGSKTYWIQRTRQMMDGCYCGPPSWSIEPKILWHASFWLLISPTSALARRQIFNELVSIQSKLTNSSLLPKLLWPSVRKNCSSDGKKLLKFEA